jgi:hypothetical protein
VTDALLQVAAVSRQQASATAVRAAKGCHLVFPFFG